MRSVIKSVTWRIIGLALLGGLAFVVTGNPLESLVITILFNGVRLFLYVGHEEAWERWTPLSRIGRGPSPATPRDFGRLALSRRDAGGEDGGRSG